MDWDGVCPWKILCYRPPTWVSNGLVPKSSYLPNPHANEEGDKKTSSESKRGGRGGVGGGGVLLNFTILLGKKNRSYGVSDLVGTNHRSIRIYFRASSTHRNNENRINVMVWDILRGGSRPVQRAAP